MSWKCKLHCSYQWWLITCLVCDSVFKLTCNLSLLFLMRRRGIICEIYYAQNIHKWWLIVINNGADKVAVLVESSFTAALLRSSFHFMTDLLQWTLASPSLFYFFYCSWFNVIGLETTCHLLTLAKRFLLHCARWPWLGRCYVSVVNSCD